MDLLYYVVGGALIALLVRWWRPDLSRRAAEGYILAAGLFFVVPLATPWLQVDTDIAYAWAPWRETLPQPETLRPGNPVLADLPTLIIPFRELARRRLLNLEAPLWAHELGTGQPLLGNAQSAPFAPLHLLALPLPTLRALTVTAAWQVLLALLLTHALARALGAGEAGSSLAALAFSFSTFVIPWAYHPIGMAAAWMPGVLLGLVLLRRGDRGGGPGLVVCAVGLATSGHPESVAHMALVGGVVAAVFLIQRGEPGWPSRRAFAGRLGVAAALTFCLTAPVLLPILEAVTESERWLMVHQVPPPVQTAPFQAGFAAALVNPLAFGSPRDGNWIGSFNFNETCSGYAGAVTLALALAGALVVRGRVAWILAGGLAALATAFRLPPLYEMVSALPAMEGAMQGRLRLYWILAVALAAGVSLEELGRRGGRLAGGALLAVGVALIVIVPQLQAWQWGWWIVTLVGIAAVALRVLTPRPPLPSPSPPSPGRGGATTQQPESQIGESQMGGGSPSPPGRGGQGVRIRSVEPAFFSRIALLAVALDLALLGVRFHPLVPPSFDLAPTPSLAFLMEAERKSPEPFRVLAEYGDLLPNLASYYGLWDARGNDPMQPAAALGVAGRLLNPDYRVGLPNNLETLRFPFGGQAGIDRLGVRYLLTRAARRLPAPWTPVFDGPDGRVWKNARARPIFFSMSPESQEDRVTIERVRPNGFDLTVETRTGGLVASSVSHARGWRLLIDGRSNAVRIDSGFVGFEVPPGRHRAILDYRPAGWTWGLRFFGLGLIGILGYCLGRRWTSSTT